MAKVNAKKLALERTKIFHQNEIHISPIKSIHENVLTQVNTELKSIETPIEPKMVSFDFDSYKMSAELNNLGKFVEIVRSGILKYQLNVKFISKIGKYGNGELEFDWLPGLTMDESNGNIYVNDYNINRIQILSQDFRFIFQFGKDILKKPLDVKLSKECIFVLHESNLCLHFFNYNHILQKSVISRGKGKQVIDPFTSSSTKLIIFLFQIEVLTLFISSIKDSN